MKHDSPAPSPSPINECNPTQTHQSKPQPFLEHIIAGASLSSTDVEAAFDRILAGADPVQVRTLRSIWLWVQPD